METIIKWISVDEGLPEIDHEDDLHHYDTGEKLICSDYVWAVVKNTNPTMDSFSKQGIDSDNEPRLQEVIYVENWKELRFETPWIALDMGCQFCYDVHWWCKYDDVQLPAFPKGFKIDTDEPKYTLKQLRQAFGAGAYSVKK